VERKAFILLVDDTPESLMLLEAILAEADREITTASSGVQALELLENPDFADRCAAIVLDVHMPVMDGFETAAKVKQRPETSDIPIIFLTGSADSSQIFRGYQSGAVDYMTKPFEPEVLQSKIAIFVDLWEKTQELQELAELRRQRDLAQLRRESEQSYRTLTNAMPQIAWLSAPNGLVQYFNQRWFEYTGLGGDTSLGEGWLEALHPADHDTVSARWAEALARGRVFEAEMRLQRARDQAYRWHLARALPTKNDDGVTTGWVGTLTDIEDQKRVAADLAAQYAVARVLSEVEAIEQALPRILEALGSQLGWSLVALWHREGAELVCSAHWCGPGCEDGLAQAMTANPLSLSASLPGDVFANGEVRWVKDVLLDARFKRPLPAAALVHGWVGMPIVVEGAVEMVIEMFHTEIRNPDRDLLSVLTAVGSQMGQFIERERAEHELRASEQLKGAVLESAFDSVIMMDARGLITEFNPAAEVTFGYKRADVIGKEMAEMVMPPAYRDLHRAGLKRYLETGEAHILGRPLELEAMRANGTIFPCELTITRVDVPGPAVFTGYLRDITERKQAETELARRQARLALLAEAGDLLARSLEYEATVVNVAHAIVPEFADWCIAYLVEDSGAIRPLVVAHADSEREAWAQEFAERYPIDRNETTGPAEVIRSGQAALTPVIPPEMLDALFKDDPERLALLKQVGMHSYMCVPMNAHGRTIGAITFLISETDREYDREDLRLAEEIARRAGLAIDNARLYHDRNEVARTLERSLLPPSLPRVPHVEVAARYRAATAGSPIGGDFYDLFQLDPESWLAVIGDVVGKGAEAAALTGLARHTIRAAAMRETGLVSILEMLNEAINRGGGEGQFCTVVCARLHPEPSCLRVQVADAGHPLPIVIRDGKVEKVDVRGIPLGMWPDADIAVKEVELHVGDKLVLYTDGVTEARTQGEIYGEERLLAFLSAHAGLDAAALAEVLEQEVVDFQKEGVHDDIAILVIQGGDDATTPSSSLLSTGSRGAQSPRVDMRLEPAPRSVAIARHALDPLRAHISEETLATAQLLSSELVSNAVKYSFGDAEAWIGFTAEVEQDILRIEVADQGLGFNDEAELSDEDAESGRGLFLVEALSSRWGVNRGEMNRVWFELALEE
jgi:PAS domain S-box-containing protein